MESKIPDKIGYVSGRFVPMREYEILHDAYKSQQQRIDRLVEALRKIADMPDNCGGWRGESCCGCIGKAKYEAEAALEAEGVEL